MGCRSGHPLLLAAVLWLGQTPQGGVAAAQEGKLPAPASSVRTDPCGDPLPAGALQRLGTERFRLEGSGTLHVYLPDGKTLAVSTGRYVRLLDVATGKVIRVFEEHTAHLSALVLSPDGQQLAGCGNDATVRLWDVATGKEVRQFVGPSRHVRCVRFSPDGKSLAAGDMDKTILLWEVAGGKELRRFSMGERSSVFALDFSRDGKTLAVAADAPAVKQQNGWSTYKVCLLDVETGKELRQTRMQVPVFQVAFSPDGQTLMAVEPPNGGKPDSTIHLWDVAAWTHRPLPAQPEAVYKAAFAPDSKTLATGSYQKTCLWDVASGKLLPPFQGKHIPASSLVFAPDGKTLATSNGNSIRFWDPATGEERTPLSVGHQDSVLALAYQPDGRTLATVGHDQALRIWDRATGKEVADVRQLATASYPKACFSPDGKSLAWIGSNDAVHVWDVAAGKEARRVPTPAYCLGFSGDGQMLALGGKDKQPIRLWDLVAGKERLSITSRRYYDSSLALSPNGKYLTTYCEDDDETGGMVLRLWDATHGRQLRQWGEANISTGYTFSPDSRFLAVSGKSRTLWLWDLAAVQERCHFETPATARALAFSSDGKFLALGAADRNVYVYDTAAGRQLAHFQGHRGPISALSFSPDGQVLASASSDTTVLLWDVAVLQRQQPQPERPLTAQELAAFWDDLGAEGGARVQRSVWALVAAPTQTEALVKERLKAPQPVEAQRLGRLIADLDADRFVVREKATEELEKLADLAAPALQKALEGKPSLETRRRIENLLGKLSNSGTPAAEVLRGLRAIEVLERIGSKAAREQLENLAGAEPPSRLTREAQSVLQRLAARP